MFAWLKRKIDKQILGKAIKKTIADHGFTGKDAKEAEAYMWALHKILDPAYKAKHISDEEYEAIINKRSSS